MEASHMQVVGRREGRTIKTEQWVQVISQISHRQHRSNRWEMRQWDNETVETWDIQFWTRRYWMYRVIGESWWAVVLVGFSILALPEHSAVDVVGEGSVQPETDWLWWFDWWEIHLITQGKKHRISIFLKYKILRTWGSGQLKNTKNVKMRNSYNLGQWSVEMGGSISVRAPQSTRWSSAHCK